MIIEKLEMKKFGAFENATFRFTDGVNMIEGGNESGKSTIADFIKFIFYGLEKEEKPEGSDWQRYMLPEKRAEGAIELSCEKGRFRIERSIDLSDKRVSAEAVQILDLQLNAPIRGKDPAALFLGVPKELFERSLFMAQLDGRAVLPSHLGKAVENMLSSADESINAEKSADRLQTEISVLEGGAGVEGSIASARERASQLEKRMKTAIEAESEYQRLGDSMRDNAKRSAGNKSEYEVCRKRLEHADAQRKLAAVRRAGQASVDFESASAELKKAKEELAHEGFLPDRSYVRSMSQLLSESLRTEQNLGDAKERLEADRARYRDLPEPVGGREGKLLSSIGYHEKKAASARNYGIMAAGAALVFAALLVLFIVLKIVPGAIVCGALMLVAAGVAVWFFMQMKKETDVKNELYAGSGAEDREQLADAVTRNSRLIAERETLERTIEDGEKTVGRYNEALGSLLEKGKELSAKWGKTCAGTEDLKTVCVEAEEAYERLDRLAGDEKQAKLALSALEINVSEEELKELDELVRTDGIDEELDDAGYKDLTTKAKFYKQTSEALDQRIESQKKQRRSMESSMEDRFFLEEELSSQKEKIASLERALTVKKAAREAILESVAFMRAQILPDVMTEATAFFEKASAGKYVRLEARDDFSLVAYDEKGNGVPVSSFSGAMKELVYMALRFAVTRKTYGDARKPVVLDESFSNLDDLHLAASFRAVYGRAEEGKNQIVLMTCRKRETALMEMIGKINKIVL